MSGEKSMDHVRPQYAQDNRRGWHLDKTVSVSHILTTLAIAGSVFVWASKIEQRIVVVETRLENASQAANDTQRDVRELAAVVRDELRLLRIEVRDAVLAKERKP